MQRLERFEHDSKYGGGQCTFPSTTTEAQLSCMLAEDFCWGCLVGERILSWKSTNTGLVVWLCFFRKGRRGALFSLSSRTRRRLEITYSQAAARSLTCAALLYLLVLRGFTERFVKSPGTCVFFFIRDRYASSLPLPVICVPASWFWDAFFAHHVPPPLHCA